MKKIFMLGIAMCMCIGLVACGNQSGETKETKETTEKQTETTTAQEEQQEDGNGKVLVAYFSATGTTKKIAESIAEGTGGDLYEITPKDEYTEEDLDYNDNNSRSTKEMNDSSARPELSGETLEIDQYDKIFLGYPIWWAEAPRVMDTFVESYEFEGKTIIPFCTSGGSGLGSSAKRLESLAGSGDWKSGESFDGDESKEDVEKWAKEQ